MSAFRNICTILMSFSIQRKYLVFYKYNDYKKFKTWKSISSYFACKQLFVNSILSASHKSWKTSPFKRKVHFLAYSPPVTILLHFLHAPNSLKCFSSKHTWTWLSFKDSAEEERGNEYWSAPTSNTHAGQWLPGNRPWGHRGHLSRQHFLIYIFSELCVTLASLLSSIIKVLLPSMTSIQILHLIIKHSVSASLFRKGTEKC